MKMPPASSHGYHADPYDADPEGACCAQAEWRAFQRVLVEAIECVIDHAVICSGTDVEDVIALEHLRTLTRAHFAGLVVPIQMQEFLHALAILLSGFQIEPRRNPAGSRRAAGPLRVASERLRHVAHAAAAASKGPAAISAEEAFATYPEESSPRPSKRSTRRRPLKDVTSQAA